MRCTLEGDKGSEGNQETRGFSEFHQRAFDSPELVPSLRPSLNPIALI